MFHRGPRHKGFAASAKTRARLPGHSKQPLSNMRIGIVKEYDLRQGIDPRSSRHRRGDRALQIARRPVVDVTLHDNESASAAY